MRYSFSSFQTPGQVFEKHLSASLFQEEKELSDDVMATREQEVLPRTVDVRQCMPWYVNREQHFVNTIFFCKLHSSYPVSRHEHDSSQY